MTEVRPAERAAREVLLAITGVLLFAAGVLALARQDWSWAQVLALAMVQASITTAAWIDGGAS